jgi:hypothetical protein
MSQIQPKIAKHAKKEKKKKNKTIHRKKLIETDLKMTDISELADKYAKCLL